MKTTPIKGLLRSPQVTAVVEVDGGSRVVELAEDEFEILQR